MKYLSAMFAAVALFLLFTFPTLAQDDRCRNPVEVDTLGPTKEDDSVRFGTTGDSFRVSYRVFENSAGDDFEKVMLEIKKRTNGEYVALNEQPSTDDDTNQFFVSEGPGAYEVSAKVMPTGSARYKVVIAECSEATQGNGSGTGSGGNGNAAGDQYGKGDVGKGGVTNNNKIIVGSISKKPLPNTGGVPLLGLAVCALAFVGVGFSVLRATVRRDA